MGVKEGGREGGMGGRQKSGDKSPACAGMLRIEQHANLNPLRERHKHTGREDMGLSGKERDVRSSSCRSPLHLLGVGSVSCRQQLGNLSAHLKASVLITAAIPLGALCSRLLLLFPPPSASMSLAVSVHVILTHLVYQRVVFWRTHLHCSIPLSDPYVASFSWTHDSVSSFDSLRPSAKSILRTNLFGETLTTDCSALNLLKLQRFWWYFQLA